MGKKKKTGEEKQEDKARVFVLKVAMHCSCVGCIDKIRAAVKDITLLQGIESWDQSALETKGELKLVTTTADPEKLRQRLHKATRKNVDLIFPKDKDAGNKGAGNNNKQAPSADAAAQAQALLLNSLQQQQQQGQNAWGNQLLLPAAAAGGSGGGWNGAAAQSSYPWALQQQHTYPYPAAWGAYAYPPAQGLGGAWLGYGY